MNRLEDYKIYKNFSLDFYYELLEEATKQAYNKKEWGDKKRCYISPLDIKQKYWTVANAFFLAYAKFVEKRKEIVEKTIEELYKGLGEGTEYKIIDILYEESHILLFNNGLPYISSEKLKEYVSKFWTLENIKQLREFTKAFEKLYNHSDWESLENFSNCKSNQ